MTKKQIRLLSYIATWCCGLFLGALFWGGEKARPAAEVPTPQVVSDPLPAMSTNIGPEVVAPARTEIKNDGDRVRTLVQRDQVVNQIVHHAHAHGAEGLGEYCEQLIATSRTDDPLLRVEVLRGQARALDFVKGDDPRRLQLQQEACAAIDDICMLLLRMRMDCYLDYAKSLGDTQLHPQGVSADKVLAALTEVLRCYDEADRAPLSAVPSRVTTYRECVARYVIAADLAVSRMTKQQRSELFLKFSAVHQIEIFSPEMILELGAVGNTYSEGDLFEFYKWCRNYIAEQDKLATPESAKSSQTASEFLKLLEPIVKAGLRSYIESEDFQTRLQRYLKGEPPLLPRGYRVPEPTDLSPYRKKDSSPPSP